MPPDKEFQRSSCLLEEVTLIIKIYETGRFAIFPPPKQNRGQREILYAVQWALEPEIWISMSMPMLNISIMAIGSNSRIYCGGSVLLTLSTAWSVQHFLLLFFTLKTAGSFLTLFLVNYAPTKTRGQNNPFCSQNNPFHGYFWPRFQSWCIVD